MDNRVTGLIVIVSALLFLWLYDTGRWSGIVSVIKGTAPTTGSLTAAQAGSIQGTESAICSIWPESCIASTAKPGGASGGASGATSGGSSAQTGSQIGGALGSIGGPIVGAIGSALGGIFGGLFG